MLGAIETGARGYLLKDASAEGVGTAILQLLAGGSPITPAIAQHLILRFQKSAPVEARAPGPVLSEREREVLELVVKGFTFPEIARLLALSPHTIAARTWSEGGTAVALRGVPGGRSGVPCSRDTLACH